MTLQMDSIRMHQSMILIFFAVLEIFHVSLAHQIAVTSKGVDEDACCSKSTNSCRSLNFALSKCVASNSTDFGKTTILIEDFAFITGKDKILIPDMHEIDIRAKHPGSSAVLQCSSKESSLVIGSSGMGNSTINFHNLKFQSCGPIAPAAVLVYGPINVAFRHCTFSHNLCSGLNVLDSNLLVQNCLFERNYANQTNSFLVDFKFGNTSLGGSLGVMFDKGHNRSIEIQSSQFYSSETFINRDSSVISHHTGVKRLLSNYYASGGGLSIIHAFSSSSNRVVIKDCHFEGNKGTYGGGLFLSFVHNSTNNHLTLQNCTIQNNYVSQTGGGILFSCWDWAHNNTAFFIDCRLSRNDAMVGGAMKIIFNSKDLNDEDRGGLVNFEMHRAQIIENTAMSGSALRLLFNLPKGRIAPKLPKFVNCTIKGHKPSRNSKEYPGAILSTRLGLEFDGENILSSNLRGSAIYVSACTLNVKGKLTLMNNQGMKGGAIYLADTSRIVLYPNSHLEVIGNHADFRGGGFYVEAVTLQETTYPYNPSCFIQYAEAKVAPSKWQVLVKFHNNSASMKGAAIFVRSLVDCLWDENPPHSNVHKSLRWADKFIYSGNFLLREGQRQTMIGPNFDIATDTYDIKTNLVGSSLKLAPGESLLLNISATDQLGNKIYSVPSIKHVIKRTMNASKQDVIYGPQYFVLPQDRSKVDYTLKIPSSNNYRSTAGIPDVEFLRLSATQSSFLIETDLPIYTEKCHPGFQFVDSSCVCNSNLSGIERCSMGRYVYLKEGYWGGMVNGEFVTSICPRGYCACRKEEGKPGCLYDSKNPDNLCIEGRENILCGRCKDGLALGLRSTECRDCTGTGWFLAISMFGVLLATLLILYFNPNIPSDLRGILFYIQVLPFLFKPNDRVGDFVHLMSGISDLGRPTEYPFSTCAVPNLGNLGTTTLNYVTPAEVLVILFFIFIFRRHINLNRSRPFQSFLVMMLLMYKYVVETSFALIHCVNVGDKTVFFYDGSWECFQGFHLAFLIIAVIVWFVFLFLPIPAIFIIVHNGAETYGRIRIHQPTVDAIAEGLRRHEIGGHCSRCGQELSGKNRFSQVVGAANMVKEDPLSPCLTKAGKPCKACAKRANQCWLDYIGKERGWWWAVDLMRRQFLVAIYVFIQDWELKQLILTIACSFIFALHCLAWPYSKKNAWANRIESLYLLALVVLANIQSLQNQSYRHNVSVVILIVTYSFALLLFLYKALRFSRKWNRKRKQRAHEQQTVDLGVVNKNVDSS